MDIHKKFSCIQEYTDFVTELLNWTNSNKSLWKEEDLPKLKPFFDFSRNKQTNKNYSGIWTDTIQDSFEYYNKCSELYGQKNAEMRDSLSRININDLISAFYFKHKYSDEECEDNEDLLNNNEIVLDDFPYSFPLIVTGVIESGFDRIGDLSMLMIRFVSLSEFN